MGEAPRGIGRPFDSSNPPVGYRGGTSLFQPSLKYVSATLYSSIFLHGLSSLSQPPQLWQNEITLELRSHLIKKLLVKLCSVKVFIFCLASVEAIYFVPLQDPVAMQDPRIAHLVQYAINVEKSMFENARSRVSTITVYIILLY